ncbi:MAG: bacteriohemerythrin [Planctomycetota bacterium]|jgi:hemerythrin
MNKSQYEPQRKEGAMLVWEDRYELGIPRIDIQHKRLFGLIAELHYTATEGVTPHLKALLQEMQGYSDYHFNTEEELFTACGYEDAENHCQQHRLFCDSVKGYYQDFEACDPTLRLKASLFLQNWWSVHVLDVDRRYVETVKAGQID